MKSCVLNIVPVVAGRRSQTPITTAVPASRAAAARLRVVGPGTSTAFSNSSAAISRLASPVAG